MSQTPEITPALTPKEWARWQTKGRDELAEMHDGRFLTISDSGRGTELTAGARHSLAALCLYEQPFGFTQEDVKLLGDLARGVQATLLLSTKPSAWPSHYGEPQRAAVMSIADRIAALLPPSP